MRRLLDGTLMKERPELAVTLVDNHDTQRDGGLTYRDGDAYRLANVWMLAQPYGYPKIMSSYAFVAGPA